MIETKIDTKARTEIPGPLYSNYDHSLDFLIAKKMRESPDKFYSHHPGLGRNGLIIYTGEVWIEEVWRNGQIIASRQSHSLESLINSVNNAYGWE